MTRTAGRLQHTRTLTAAVGLSVTTLVLLVGCASTPGDGGTASAIASPTFTAVSPTPGSGGDELHVRWTDSARTAVAVTTVGSSSCPKVPEAVRYDSRTRLTFRMKDWGDRACTMDLVPHTSVVPIDASRLDTSSSITVQLVAGPDAKPTAGSVVKLTP